MAMLEQMELAHSISKSSLKPSKTVTLSVPLFEGLPLTRKLIYARWLINVTDESNLEMVEQEVSRTRVQKARKR